MPFPVQVQRFARLLQRRFGLQGMVPLTILEDAMPVVPITGDDAAAAYHKDEKRCVTGFLNPAVAGQFGGVYLRNPSGSRVLTTVETFWVTLTGAAGTRGFFLRGTPTGLAFTNHQRDGRWSSLDRPFSTVTQALGYNNAAHQGGRDFHVLTANSSPFPCDVVLAPGDDFVLETEDQNATLNAVMLWREWPLAPGEEVVGG